jgi:hypothetical protein
MNQIQKAQQDNVDMSKGLMVDMPDEGQVKIPSYQIQEYLDRMNAKREGDTAVANMANAAGPPRVADASQQTKQVQQEVQKPDVSDASRAKGDTAADTFQDMAAKMMDAVKGMNDNPGDPANLDRMQSMARDMIDSSRQIMRPGPRTGVGPPDLSKPIGPEATPTPQPQNMGSIAPTIDSARIQIANATFDASFGERVADVLRSATGTGGPVAIDASVVDSLPQIMKLLRAVPTSTFEAPKDVPPPSEADSTPVPQLIDFKKFMSPPPVVVPPAQAAEAPKSEESKQKRDTGQAEVVQAIRESTTAIVNELKIGRTSGSGPSDYFGAAARNGWA